MRVQGIEIVDQSVSGYATAVTLPQYNLCFDLGIASPEALRCDYVAITHGHLDHFGGLARHGHIRELARRGPSHYVVPLGCSNRHVRLSPSGRASRGLLVPLTRFM